MLEGVLVDLVPYGRAFETQDHAWRNGPGVFYWAMGDHWFVTEAMIARWRGEDESEDRRRDHRIEFGIRTKAGQPIGLMGINYWDATHRTAMLTALIGDPVYWGGGYGTDALLLLIEYAFEWLDARKVWLMTMANNARVLRQMEKAGFQGEVVSRGLARVGLEWVDAPIFGLLRREWPGYDAMAARLGLNERAT